MAVVLALFLTAATSPVEHPCLGDFVYRGNSDEVSIGARIRREPDYAEVLFSDYGNVQSGAIQWNESSVTITDQADASSIVIVCEEGRATLVLPGADDQPARTFRMRRTQGSLWDVGQREGWLTPSE